MLPYAITPFVYESPCPMVATSWSLLSLHRPLNLFNLPFIRRLTRILRWLYCVFIQFALSFFLVFSFLCYFFLTLLKIEIRFRHLVAPFEKIFFMNFGPPLMQGLCRVRRMPGWQLHYTRMPGRCIHPWWKERKGCFSCGRGWDPILWMLKKRTIADNSNITISHSRERSTMPRYKA